jgi:hypothetical protein
MNPDLNALLDKAIQIATAAHAGQIDKSGLPYITHPLRIMADAQGMEVKIVAVLHDVLEDTATTADDLRRAGFSEALLASLALVTHRPEESYADYVVHCKADPVARQVKLGDLKDNSRLDRTMLRVGRIDGDFARIHRYLLSYQFLTDALSETDYRALMAKHG